MFRNVLLFSHPSASAVSFGLELSVEDCLIKNVFASHSTLGSLKSAMEKVDEDINGVALDSYRDYTDFAKENLEYMNEDDYLNCYYYSNLTFIAFA